MAADLNGYDPFPSPTRYPGRDFVPGPFSVYVVSDSRWAEIDWTPAKSPQGGPLNSDYGTPNH